MNATFEEVAKQAIDLAPHQRLALAGFLLEADSGASTPDIDQAWETEIAARIHAVDIGAIKGIPFSEVMRQVDERLAP